MKYITSLLFLATMASATAQNTALNSATVSNPPSMQEMSNTPKQNAEFMTMQIQKICGVNDKAELSELLRVCYEYQLDMSMDNVKSNENEMTRAATDLDKAIKKIVGSSKMNTYTEWVNGGGKILPEDYVD
jgi:hypothetical protein